MRHFTFFEQINQQLQIDYNVDLLHSNNGLLLIGDDQGSIHIFGSSEQEELTRFGSHQLITHLLLKRVGDVEIIYSCGLDDDNIPILKLFTLQGVLIRSLVVAVQDQINSVTAIAQSQDGYVFAIGLNNGLIIVYYGDLRYKYRQRTVQISSGSITNIQVFQNIMFVTTSSQAVAFNLSNLQELYRDEIGCETGACSVVYDYQVALCRSDAIYLFDAEGRGPCFVLAEQPLPVLQAVSFKHYIGVLVASGSADDSLRRCRLSIYDVKNKIMAFSQTFEKEKVYLAVSDDILAFQNNKIHRLKEMSTNKKLQLLYAKDLYPIALNMAYTLNYDKQILSEITCKYADHLYSKHQYQDALLQYIDSIGKGVEPSYVIRKFLDGGKIKFLCKYLEAVHKNDIASSHHTTLLLNCYTKLKDIDQLENFIGTRLDKSADVYFDVEAALAVCRDAGLYDQAISLSTKFKVHDVVVAILVDDLRDYSGALTYMEQNKLENVSNLKKYGALLLSHLPQETTSVLLNVCQLFLKGEGPIQFVPIFVQHRHFLIQFLEKIIAQASISQQASVDIYNMLIELYLSSKEDREVYQSELDRLLEDDSKYDVDQALIQCQMNDYVPGQLLIYNKQKRFREVLQLYMSNEDLENLLSQCRLYYHQDKTLWIDLLNYFGNYCGQRDVKSYVKEVLKYVVEYELLPMVKIIEILCCNKTLTLDVVQDVLLKQAIEDEQSIKQNLESIAALQAESDQVSKQIEELKTGPQILQVSSCSACSNKLDLPSMHFLCKHSFHIRCLGENERECPKCATEHRMILDIQLSQRESARDDEQFYNKLRESTDGFSVITDYLGRNTFLKSV